MKRRHNIKACRRLSQPSDPIMLGVRETALDLLAAEAVRIAFESAHKRIAEFFRTMPLIVDAIQRRN
jgi:hypothetical protein